MLKTLHRLSWIRGLCLWAIVWLGVALVSPPAQAADAYVARYLQVTEPIALAKDDRGNSQSFSLPDLTAGKKLFEQNCLSCHVGGATLPRPRRATVAEGSARCYSLTRHDRRSGCLFASPDDL